jgi:hypothetical protein
MAYGIFLLGEYGIRLLKIIAGIILTISLRRAASGFFRNYDTQFFKVTTLQIKKRILFALFIKLAKQFIKCQMEPCLFTSLLIL